MGQLGEILFLDMTVRANDEHTTKVGYPTYIAKHLYDIADLSSPIMTSLH